MKRVATLGVVLAVVLVMAVSGTAVAQPVTEESPADGESSVFIMNGPVDEASPVETTGAFGTLGAEGGAPGFVLNEPAEEVSPIETSNGDDALPADPPVGEEAPPGGSGTVHVVF